MNRKYSLLTVLLAATALTTAAPASAGGPEGRSHYHAGKSNKAKNPSIKAYLKANEVMHKGMDITYSGDADVDFVRGMIPHHQGAVDMAKVILEYGDDTEMKELAQRIITWQESEISTMNAWLAGRDSKWRADNAEALESVKAYVESMEVMHRDMNIDYTGDADVDFARGMIPHHQGAIDMAWVLKEHGRDFALRRFADEIIRSQGQEIRLMEEWLAKQPALPVVKKKMKTKHCGHGKSHH